MSRLTTRAKATGSAAASVRVDVQTTAARRGNSTSEHEVRKSIGVSLPVAPEVERPRYLCVALCRGAHPRAVERVDGEAKPFEIGTNAAGTLRGNSPQEPAVEPGQLGPHPYKVIFAIHHAKSCKCVLGREFSRLGHCSPMTPERPRPWVATLALP